MGLLHGDNEAARLAALRRYNLLDTEAEQIFDDIVTAAAVICGSPMAMISLIDENRQWFKAKVGLEATETPRNVAFCDHAIRNPDTTLIVEDATQDQRFSDNPLVTGEQHIRFYMGAPLKDRDGMALGTLCVIDSTPQHPTETQVRALEALRRVVIHELEQRDMARALATALISVKSLSGLLPICSYCKSIRNDEGSWDSLYEYLSAHAGVDLTHGICPSCLVQHFPGFGEVKP